MRKEEVLESLNNYLDEKGIGKGEKHLDPHERLRKYGLSSLAATKGILQDIFSYRPPSGSNPIRVIKNKIINLIRNVSISTIELVVIKQNKFNELTYQFIEMLIEENKELKEKVKELEDKIVK